MLGYLFIHSAVGGALLAFAQKMKKKAFYCRP